MKKLSRTLIKLIAILLLFNFYSCECTTAGDCPVNGGFVLVSFEEDGSPDKLGIEDLNIDIKSDLRPSITFSKVLLDSGRTEALQIFLLDKEECDLNFSSYAPVALNLLTKKVVSGKCCDGYAIESVSSNEEDVACDSGNQSDCIFTITLAK